MTQPAAIENRARICRTTCGWKRPELSLEQVCRYWRDVHSPAIARRAGIYEYRHFQFAPVRPDLFPAVAGLETAAPADEQLMWVSDVRYADEAGLDAFGASPGPEEKALMLADIEMIVDKSTTYLVRGENGRTLVDRSDGIPIGPVSSPTYALFVRARTLEPEFRRAMTELAGRWAGRPGVLRLRLSLFEAPDMEAERRAGYPVKTHPAEMQYQAWIDITLESDAVAADLVAGEDAAHLAAHARVLHAYPTRVAFTFVYAGRPTLVGLRGFSAYEAITAMGAAQQADPRLLTWLYGDVVQGGPAK